MKNKEKYANEIVEIAISGAGLAVNKTTLTPINCNEIRCEDCVRCDCYDKDGENNVKGWAEQEYMPYVDWTKVKRDTPVLVSDDNEIWHKRHFAIYENGEVYVYIDGRTSFTAKDDEVTSWGYTKLAEVEGND